MSQNRTAVLSFLPSVYPETLLPHVEGNLDLSVEELGDLLPEGRDILHGVRDGGWQLCFVAIETGVTEDFDGRAMSDVPINFTKEFSPPDIQAAIADARACGASPYWGLPQVLWADVRDDPDDETVNGTWDISDERVGC